MKKIFAIILAIFIPTYHLFGCDVCGGGSLNTNSNLGYINTLQKPFLMFSHQRMNFQSTFFEDFILDKISISQLQYNWIPQNNVILSASANIKSLSRTISGPSQGNFSYVELGDVQFNSNFKIYDNRDSVFQLHKHLCYFGTSIKLPSGKYQIRDHTKQIIPLNQQPGNGAYGISFSTFYAYKNPKFGVNVNSKVTFFTENELNYKNGSQYTFSLGIFKPLKVNKTLIIPQFALNYEYLTTDSEFKEELPTTGNQIKILNSQIEILHDNLIITAGYHLILEQLNLLNNQKISNRLNLGFGWIF
jgi:hypothetical protein